MVRPHAYASACARGRRSVGPYRRLSASQINLWDACPRQWFFEKVRRLKIAQTPPLHLGRAVEAAVCMTLRESPGLIVAGAPHDVLSGTPLDDEDRPDRKPSKAGRRTDCFRSRIAQPHWTTFERGPTHEPRSMCRFVWRLSGPLGKHMNAKAGCGKTASVQKEC